MSNVIHREKNLALNCNTLAYRKGIKARRNMRESTKKYIFNFEKITPIEIEPTTSKIQSPVSIHFCKQRFKNSNTSHQLQKHMLIKAMQRKCCQKGAKIYASEQV